MEITNAFKKEILTNSKAIENIEVLYKKKDRFSGIIAFVKEEPFEIKILDQDKEANEAEHSIFFGKAQQITLRFFDGTIKDFKEIN